MLVVPAGIVTLVRLEHAPNARSPMSTTPVPIVTFVRLVQRSNVWLQILRTLLGIAILESLLHPLKAPERLTRFSESVTFSTLLHPANAANPRLTILFGSVISVSAVQ